MKWIEDLFLGYKIITEYDAIEDKSNKREIHGLKSKEGCRCMFCGDPYENWRKKDTVHAISECVGNKSLITYTNLVKMAIISIT